jgi:hypothetical protein
MTGNLSVEMKLCVDVNDYDKLIYGLKIHNACSVLQLSTLEHINSQCKIIFKIQGIISGRDFAAIGAEIWLLYT